MLSLRAPPLRERPEDFGPLVDTFLEGFAKTHRKPRARVDPDALAFLAAQPWPGNVRQLQNFLERLVVLTDGPVLSRANVMQELQGLSLVSGQSPETPSHPAGTLDSQREGAEREAIRDALSRANQNHTLAAKLLGVSRRTLYNKLEEHGLLAP